MTTIISAKFLKSAAKNEHAPIDDRPEFVMIGRSNVGKSTLINALSNNRSLALTSSKPGKTNLINYFDIVSRDDDGISKSRYLVDLPWYGYAAVSKSKGKAWWTMITEYLIHKNNLAHIFILIDSSIPAQDIDLEFIQRIYGNRKPFSLVFTKIDKATQKQSSYNIKQFMLTLGQMISAEPNCYVTSGLKPHSTQAIVDDIHMSV